MKDKELRRLAAGSPVSRRHYGHLASMSDQCARDARSKAKVAAFGIAAALTLYVSPCAAQDATRKLNPFTGAYEVAPPDATPQFNYFTGRFEMASPGAIPKFNPQTGKYEIGTPTTAPKNNLTLKKTNPTPLNATQ